MVSPIALSGTETWQPLSVLKKKRGKSLAGRSTRVTVTRPYILPLYVSYSTLVVNYSRLNRDYTQLWILLHRGTKIAATTPDGRFDPVYFAAVWFILVPDAVRLGTAARSA